MPSPSDITFFMVGCQRSGTTWVDAALRSHPEVFLPPQKQTYFFDEHYDKGLAWYLDNFKGITTAHKAVGEIGHGYCLISAIPRMARDFPHVRLLMTMRHPVDRAYSKFLKLSITKASTGAPDPHAHHDANAAFDAALENEPDILERGRYIEQIEALLQHYPRERLLLCLYDDFAKDDRAYFRSICRFIGVDEDFQTPEFGQQRNAASLPGLRTSLNRMGLKPLLRVLSKSWVGNALRRAKKKSGKKGYSGMDPQTRQRLCQYYRPYNDRLATFMNRDLSAWNR